MTTRPNPLSYGPYLEALELERISRDAAVLGVRESIGEFEAMPLTLWHLMVLRIMRHPILLDRPPSPDQLRDFLWLVSPDYSPANLRGKAKFTRRCHNLFYPPRYLPLLNTRGARMRYEVKRLKRMAVAARLVEACQAYVKSAMQDRPPIRCKGFEPDYYSDGVAFCAQFGREFSWPPEVTMRMPLKVVFQHLNEMKWYNGSRVPLCNPSDSVKAGFWRDINQSLAQEREDRNIKLRVATEQFLAAEALKPKKKERRK